MLFGTIGSAYAPDMTRPAVKKAFAFLQRKDLATLPVGWIDLGEGVRASVQRYETAPRESLSFETHEAFIDIQYLIEGEEYIDCCSRKGLTEKTAYAPGDDVAFYEDPALFSSVLLRAGDYVILLPEDAHKPRCAAGAGMSVKKIVVKVPV